MTKNELSSEKVILDILAGPDSQSALAKKYNCSRSAIGKIRRGELHADILPDIPRRIEVKYRRSCVKCLYFSGKRCSLGWPDPEMDGPVAAAKYCEDYKKKKSVMATSLTDSEIEQAFRSYWKESFSTLPIREYTLQSHLGFGRYLANIICKQQNREQQR